ncbi:MAG: hypothetical protein J0I06_19920, partial [Planctomycetes bacterium]|nr:hypothetical protein [Planctomycetota bacterium]
MDTPDFPLSVVVTSRNDNHGGSLLRRMQAFVNGFVGQCKRHNLAAELIIVEWNPPADRPPLAEALKWPDDFGPCVVRIIRVPHEIHARLRHSATLPLFQMIAKNVGIRRARGKFVLATNIDILFSDELMEFLASGRLEGGRCYRIDRHDVATDVPVDGSVEEQLTFCRNNFLRLNARVGTFRLTPDGRMCPEQTDVFDEGEFYIDENWSPPDRWYVGGQPSRWLGKETALTLRAPEGPQRPLRMTLVSGPAVGFAPFDLEVRDDAGAVVARGRVDNHLRQFDVSLPLRPGEIGRFRFCVPVPLVAESEGAGRERVLQLNYCERAVRLNYCGWAPAGPCDSVPQPDGLNFADVATPPV